MFLFGAGLGTTKENEGEAAGLGVVCGPNAERFKSDQCELGSGGGLAVAAAVMTMVCGVMACFVKVGDKSTHA